MDDSIIPPMPDFLLAKNRKKPRKRKIKTEAWVMPERKETRSQRRQTKEEHDKMVLAAVKNGADTFMKIRKESSDDLETKHIANAIRRNIGLRRITKEGRRYYPFGDRRR